MFDTSNSILRYALRIPIYVISFFIPSDNTVWVFTAGDGTWFSENTKYLFLYAATRTDAVRPIWISKDSELTLTLQNAGYEAYTFSSLKGRYLSLRAGIICITHGIPFWEYSGNSKVYQLFHGNPLKTMGSDKPKDIGIAARLFKKYVSQNWEGLVVTSDDLPATIFPSAYPVEEDDFIVSGYPRNDILFTDIDNADLFQDTQRQELFEQRSSEGPLICYMPTWRRAFFEEDGTVLSDDQFQFDKLNEVLEQHDATFIIKLHPASSAEFDVTAYDSIQCVSEKLDIYPFLNLIDILVTDYSSIYFDYLLLDRPIIFYPFDKDSYEQSRGFYFDYNEITPGPMAFTPPELRHTLDEILSGKDEFTAERAQIRDRMFKNKDGRSSERLYKIIYDENIG